jgi:quinol monooxygenase YgiN
MQRKALWASVVGVVALAIAASQAQQMQEDYLDVFTVQVKPEKRAEFDALTRKMVAANRQNHGDIWLTMETAYGPGNRVTFISTRHSYAEIEKATAIFNEALEKAYGKASADKMDQDFSQSIVSSRSEIRGRRWDLSSNAPSDPAAYAKLLGETRWLRTTVVHLKPGQIASFEALAKEVKAARDKSSPTQTVFVSQAVAGQEGTVFYITTLQNSLAGFDGLPSMQQMLGDEGYQKFLKTNAEAISGTETVINRFLPELSNAPEQIVAVAPDYWQPKAAAAINAKAHAVKSPVVPASTTRKMEEKPKQ